MRFGMSLLTQKGKKQIIVSAKRNNWRPTKAEPEVPDCLGYVGQKHLTKVGEILKISEESPTFRLLYRYLDGQDPEQVEITKATQSLSNLVTKEIKCACERMRRKGMDNPTAGTLLARSVFRAVQEKIHA